MTALLRHRGPDDEGFLTVGRNGVTAWGGADTPPAAYQAEAPFRPAARWEESNDTVEAWLALGHRRLSILDLSPLGHQPMSYGGRYWIVYNGEVYNYLELRAELEAAGDRFLSHSDTEVILAAYARWGSQCLNRFNGMWALAIYDSQTQQLFLARDRFGVKPLYYWQSDGLLAFASEIKAFTVLPGWRARLDAQAAHDFLVSAHQDHSAHTLFADVRQLEPGHSLLLDGRACARGDNVAPTVQPTRWYQLNPVATDLPWPEAGPEFQRLLTDAVRLRLRSDVSVGSCLSGGLDSSSIVCLANRLLKEQNSQARQKTFSACSERREFDERPFIQHVVQATGVDAHEVFPTAEGLFGELDRLLWHQDEPFISTSIYAQWCVFGLAAQAGVKVMLDGQGADEHLYGYPGFQRPFLAGLMRRGLPGLVWQEARARQPRRSKALSAWTRALADTAIPLSTRNRFREQRQHRKAPAWLAHASLGATFPGPLAAKFHGYQDARGYSLEMLGGFNLQKLLHWEDRNSMAHSIESRVPFLDYRLVEFVVSLPDPYKIRDGQTKAVLRSGLRGLVPSAVLDRRDKMGFVTPEEIWATQSAAGPFAGALTAAVASSRGLLTPAAQSAWAEVSAGRARYRSDFWRMIAFGRWLELFKVTH